jgi:IS605 OrfB family transposase
VSALRAIVDPFVVAAPAGARVRTRLHVTPCDAVVLWRVGQHLGGLAGGDVAARCREGRLDAKGAAASRRERKRALTPLASSRWAGAITRTSDEGYQLAMRNLGAERDSLAARMRTITGRLAAPVGGWVGAGRGRVRGYVSVVERHAKTLRLQTLTTRLARVQARLDAGAPSVVRGGKSLLGKRNNLTGAGLSGQQWRAQWQSSRLFLTADGEKDKALGNETIRFNPATGTVEVKLPAPLADLSNAPHGRYRLTNPVAFTYRRADVADQVATAAIRYDISHNPATGRWYLDASWKTAPATPPTLAQLRTAPVVAVDVNTDHLAVSTLTPDGNPLGTPFTLHLHLTGLPSTTRDARVRDAVSRIIDHATTVGARAVVIENLDFTDARQQGRERHGNRPSRGRSGRAFRHQVAGIPTAVFRDRLTHMTHNAGLAVIAVDPAYTSRWAAQHWLAPLRAHHPHTTGHHAAALVIGRRGLGHRARRRTTGPAAPATRPGTGNPPAPAEAHRSPQMRPKDHPATGNAPTKDATRNGPRHTNKTGRPKPAQATRQATQDRSRPPPKQDSLLPGQ